EIYEGFSYNIQVGYALGYYNVEEGHFELRTMYNFRKRLTAHMQETGMFMKTAALFRLVKCIWGEMRFFAPPSAFFTYSLNLRTVF
ncbi:hypothetical protein MNBD_CHLOROFLEXI01-2186, partial [hydrothermal vent metagenome]